MRKTVIKLVLGACALYMGGSLAYEHIYKDEIKQKNEQASAAKILSRSLNDKIPTKAWIDSLKKQNSSIYILRTCDAGKANLMGRFVHVDDAEDPFNIEQTTDAFAFGKKSWLELLVDVENASYSQYELNAEDSGASLKYSADEDLGVGEVTDYSLEALNTVVGSRFTTNFCVKNYVKNEFPENSTYSDKLSLLFKVANISLEKTAKTADKEDAMGETTHVFKTMAEALNFLSVVKTYMPEAEQTYRRFNSTGTNSDNLKSIQQVISFGFLKDNLSLEVIERTDNTGKSVYIVRAVEV